MRRLPARSYIHISQHPIALIARVLDSLGIGVSLYLSVLLSDSVADGWERIHAFYAILAILLMQFFSEFLSVYQNWRITNTMWTRAKMVGMAALAWFFTGLSLFAIAIIFDQEPEQLDYRLAELWTILTITSFAFIRLGLNIAVRLLRKQGINVKRIAIAGAGPIGQYVKAQLEDNPWVGYELVGIYDDRSHHVYQNRRVINRRKREVVGEMKTGLQVTGKFQDLYDEAIAGGIDAVFIAMPMRAEHKILEISRHLSYSMSAVYVVPDFYSIETHFTHLVDVNGMPAVSVYENPVSGLRGVVKRTEDIVLSLIILSIIIVPMIFIALGVKLTSRGPILFKQTRYGLDGKPIKVWKFRSMRVMENGKDFRQAVRDDPRITAFGAFIRKTSLDELPQFFNVLQGRMSIVGPRPHAIAHNEAYRNMIRGYMLRHKTKPGITGWAQVNGYRGETDTLDKMQARLIYDIDYIRRWSIFLDLKIVLMTVFKGFSGKHVY